MKSYKQLLEARNNYVLKVEKDKDGNRINVIYKDGKRIAHAYFSYVDDDFLVTLDKKNSKVVYVDEKKDIINAVKKLEKS